jgi:hypothetical protein
MIKCENNWANIKSRTTLLAPDGADRPGNTRREKSEVVQVQRCFGANPPRR